jgi:putative ABC transport system substrate-binding protein
VGVIASLARPGGNITGQSSQAADASNKRVELLKELVPGAARMSVFMNMSNPYLALEWSENERAMRSLAIEPRVFDIRTREDIERAFEMASTARTDAVLVGSDTLTQSNRLLVVELAAKYRLPAMYEVREYVEAGGLISYGVNVPELYRSAATFVDKIFKGSNPGDLPVAQPTKFELVINLKTAKALSLKLPPTFIVQADEVIE